MKTIIKPAEKEEAAYFSDFSGRSLGELVPPVELNINFNYGSINDGVEIKLQLDDEDAKPILDIIKNSVSEDFKQKIKKYIANCEKNFEDSMQMRDWSNCDYLSDSLSFWRGFLNLNE